MSDDLETVVIVTGFVTLALIVGTLFGVAYAHLVVWAWGWL